VPFYFVLLLTQAFKFFILYAKKDCLLFKKINEIIYDYISTLDILKQSLEQKQLLLIFTSSPGNHR